MGISLVRLASVSVAFALLSPVVHALPSELNQLTAQGFTDGACTSGFRQTLERLEAKSGAQLFPGGLARASKAAIGGELTQIFGIKIKLDEQLRATPSPSNACIELYRRAFNSIRYIETMLGESYATRDSEANEPKTVFGGRAPYTMVNPRYGSLAPRAGDVILDRAEEFVSAMIAQSADRPGNFAHIALISANSKGDLFVVEALPASGVSVEPWAKYAKEHDTRMQLMRFNDPALGEAKSREVALAAARAMFKFLVPNENRFDEDGDMVSREIKYDYSMVPGTSEKMFCSEVVYLAYRWAGVPVPQVMSTFRAVMNTHIGADLGMKATVTVAPGDIEVDPRFEIVGESRVFSEFKALRQQDIAIRSLVKWMARDGYVFSHDMFASAFGDLLAKARSMGYFAEELSDQTTAALIKSALRLNAISRKIQGWAAERDRVNEAQTGVMMSNSELMAGVERDLYADCNNYVLARGSSTNRDGLAQPENEFLHTLLTLPDNMQCEPRLRRYR